MPAPPPPMMKGSGSPPPPPPPLSTDVMMIGDTNFDDPTGKSIGSE